MSKGSVRATGCLTFLRIARARRTTPNDIIVVEAEISLR